MIAFTDVHYADEWARAALVLASNWPDATEARSVVERVAPTKSADKSAGAIAAYEPGQFFKRELPCLLRVLEKAGPVQCVVIDGYVWLDREGAPGLGAHLYEALGRGVPVIGIAKTAFKGSDMALRLERPGSKKPLFVTAAGMTPEAALANARRLHGEHRIPTLLKRVDSLARGH
ncbi:MAG: endonuclease V [Archangium sp.]|nr:endonuclease V [Archangium sp.]